MKKFFYWIISLGMLIGNIQLGFAHNGVVATAVNIDGITIDGDLVKIMSLRADILLYKAPNLKHLVTL